MKELDFDELDKAVNSLMGSVSKDAQTPKAADDEAGKTLTISPTLDDSAKPDFANMDTKAAQAAPQTTPASAPSSSVTVPARPQASAPAARRGGRFMDVVHPSSDMKQPTVPARPVSREGVTIAPAAAPSQPAVEPALKVEEIPAPTPITAPVEAAPVTNTSNDWPDPLDMATNFKQPEAPEASSDSSKEVTEEKQEPAAVASEPAMPLTSPFLADAKVEKRPLGGAPVESTESGEDLLKPEEIKDDSMTVSDPEDQLPADPEKIDMPLPEELRSDLVAIESGAHMERLTAGETHDDMPASDKKEDSKDAPAEEKKPLSLPPESKEVKDAAPAPSGPTSIAQQYREEPSSGDQSNGAIYDTDTYHQPLEHPVKKKSGWMWVLWIVLILVIGAGGGAALYFLGLI
ncbi:MAG TPA: hypothetical protein VFZ62_03190 [Candidatus Saccharimonadales bacterium]